MRLTAHTDYALRIMLHAALIDDEALLNIAEVAQKHGISRNNTMKVVNQLAQSGLLETVRGRTGGFRLAKRPENITLGEIVRFTEPCFNLADCEHCVLQGNCGLTGMLKQALIAFLEVLDRQTLAQAANNSRLPF